MDEAQVDPQIEADPIEPGERSPDGRRPWVTPRVILSECAHHTAKVNNTSEVGATYGPPS